MNWISAARDLLSHPPVPTCPALTDALAAVEGGDLEGASGHLATLNEEQRLLATFIVEVAAGRAGAEAGALAGLCEGLHGLAENTIDLKNVPVSLLDAWAGAVGPKVPPALVARRDAFGYGQRLLCQTVEHLCAGGEAVQALAYAELLDPDHRSDVAKAWSQVGLGLALDEPRRAEALMRAANAGNARPMIQDGGEEASAHGVAMEAFAGGGLAADDPAVVQVVKGLQKLGRHRARKDVRSHGVATASVAASRRALEDSDAGWLAVAEVLAGLVWDEGVMWTKARGGANRARLAMMPGSPGPFSGDGAAGEGSGAVDLEALARRRAAGEDVEAEVEAALAEWDGYGSESVSRFVRGCRLCLDDARLEELLAATRPEDRAEALVEGASYALEASDERRGAWLNRGYPEGDRFGIFSAALLHLLSPERRLAGELFYAASGQAEALAHLVGLHLKEGRVEDAARVIARMGQPPIDGVWVPSYRRGNRSERALPAEEMATPASVEASPVTAETVKASLSAAKTGHELCALARGAADEETLAKVVRASRLKKWSKTGMLPWVARIRLFTGELDEAIALFETWTSGRFNEHLATPLLHTFADHLRTTGTATPSRIRSLLGVFVRIHPQWPVHAFTALARAAMHVEPSEREAMAASVREAMRSRYRRSGDFVYGLMGLAHGSADVGDTEGARALIGRAVERASADAIYFKGPALLVTLAALREALPAEEFAGRCIAALQACTRHEGRHHGQVMQLELGLRSLWPLEADITIGLFAPGVLPQVVARDLLRSVWADIEHVPEPLRVLEALWPAEAVLPEIAQECVGALASALASTGHPEAAEVQALLAEGRSA